MLSCQKLWVISSGMSLLDTEIFNLKFFKQKECYTSDAFCC